MKRNTISRTVCIGLGGWSKLVLKALQENAPWLVLREFDRDRSHADYFSDIEFPEMPEFSRVAYEMLNKDPNFKIFFDKLQDDPGFCQEPKLGFIWSVDNYLWLKDIVSEQVLELQSPNVIREIEKNGKAMAAPTSVFVLTGSGGGTGPGLTIPVLAALREIERSGFQLIVYVISLTPDAYKNIAPLQRYNAHQISAELFGFLEEHGKEQNSKTHVFRYVDHSRYGEPMAEIKLTFLYNNLYIIPSHELNQVEAALNAAHFINCYSHKATSIRAVEANFGQSQNNIIFNDLLSKGGER